MVTGTYLRVCLYLFAAHCIMSAEVIRQISDNSKNSGKREIRSPNCGGSSCGSFIENITQEFYGPVTFNTHIAESCSPPCGNPGGPVVPTFKSGKFIVNFTMTNFGLDLYYLMDATVTFETDRQFLAGKTEEFLTSLQQLSSDFQLGFGVFGDKEKGSDFLGVWNKMSLTKDTKDFGNIVRTTKTVSGGRSGGELAEDALSGLHQVAACQSKINWRPNTLRMVLLTTDELFQLPKNNTKPFDGKCHLNEDGKFEGPAYTEVDYPTLQDIRDVIKDNTIRVMFAIKEIRPVPPTPTIPQVYKNLAATIAPLPTVLKLEANSENIIQVIKEAYATAIKDVAIETTLRGPKDTVSEAVINATCLTKKDHSNDDLDFTIKVDRVCEVSRDRIATVQIDVTLPCHLETKNLHLTVNVQGHAKHEEIDISNICK